MKERNRTCREIEKEIEERTGGIKFFQHSKKSHVYTARALITGKDFERGPLMKSGLSMNSASDFDFICLEKLY